MDKRQKLAELIERPGVILVPGMYDALTARIAERPGSRRSLPRGPGSPMPIWAWATWGF